MNGPFAKNHTGALAPSPISAQDQMSPAGAAMPPISSGMPRPQKPEFIHAS
jgi:hypothetical protein